MKIEIVMPQMGESITEGTVSKWLKRVGDKVKQDETVLEISTDKVDTEIPSPGEGVLSEVLVEEGETVEVGTVLAYLESEGDGRSEQKERKKEGKAEGEKEKADSVSKKEKRKKEEEGKEKEEAEEDEEKEPVRARKDAEREKEEEPEERSRPLSPVVRNILRKEGIPAEEVERIRGSGVGGRITKSDVLAYLESRESREAPPSPEVPRLKFSYDSDRVEVETMGTMRRKIAEHMVYSKHTSPHTYTVAEVDMSRIVSFREKRKREFEKREGFKLTFTPFVLYAAVQALKKWPIVNCSVEEDRIIRKKYINLGVAVALEEGLIVPVIRDADEKNLLGLARAVWDLGTRARDKKLRPEEVKDGTFTVTNPGIFGNIFGLPIINQPQVAILGVGAVKKRTVVVEDAIAIRSMTLLSLSYDHRIIDGAVAGQFLQEIVRNLQDYNLEEAL